MHDEAAEARPLRRAADVDEHLAPPWGGEPLEHPKRTERRAEPIPPPSALLARSEYEKVFIELASGHRLQIGEELLTPVAVKGWYHAVFHNEHGEERLLSIDQVREYMDSWRE
ncbi:MAG: hypothetical protein QOH21_52, partial [Acidobacteriota bacterium]|nr:hypothetical protein [Acidobacteriota bacterium]